MTGVVLLLAAGAAAIGCTALTGAIVANASMRRWRARCAALGRELEVVASINLRNSTVADRVVTRLRSVR
jgi:hypothetical protein